MFQGLSRSSKVSHTQRTLIFPLTKNNHDKAMNNEPLASSSNRIWCLIFGRTEDPLFNVRVEDLSDFNVSDLREEFLLWGTQLPFVLHKVQGMRHEDAPDVRNFLPGTMLSGPQNWLSEYWTLEELAPAGYIHVIATPPILPPSEPKLAKLVESFEKTQLDYIAEQEEIYNSLTPLRLLETQLAAGRILNGRPAHNTGLPIGLYHPVFDNFLDRLSSTEPVPAPILTLTQKLLLASQDTHDLKYDRDQDVQCALEPLVGGAFEGMVSTGGFITGPDEACCVVMGLENELGDSGWGCDPSVRAVQLYGKYWGQSSMDGIRKRSCCPSMVLAAAGPWMCILGAVFLDRPVVQPLTDFLWIGTNPQMCSRRDYLARVFMSLAQARLELQEYYGTISGIDEQPGRFLPYITHYVDSSGRRVEFYYTGRIGGEEHSRPIFTAKLLGTDGAKEKEIVVKFVERYNPKAHALLAEEGLAPKLLFDGSATRVASGRSMIVMDFVPGVDLLYEHTAAHALVRDDIKRAMEILHGQDLVFGDLREPNMMVVRDGSGRVIGGMLVDFDWCGEHGKDVYPPAMSDQIFWAPGMEHGEPMYKEHDEKMYRRIWP